MKRSAELFGFESKCRLQPQRRSRKQRYGPMTTVIRSNINSILWIWARLWQDGRRPRASESLIAEAPFGYLKECQLFCDNACHRQSLETYLRRIASWLRWNFAKGRGWQSTELMELDFL
jgi:hypothetical protein